MKDNSADLDEGWDAPAGSNQKAKKGKLQARPATKVAARNARKAAKQAAHDADRKEARAARALAAREANTTPPRAPAAPAAPSRKAARARASDAGASRTSASLGNPSGDAAEDESASEADSVPPPKKSDARSLFSSDGATPLGIPRNVGIAAAAVIGLLAVIALVFLRMKKS